jgi:hypothetical protein
MDTMYVFAQIIKVVLAGALVHVLAEVLLALVAPCLTSAERIPCPSHCVPSARALTFNLAFPLFQKTDMAVRDLYAVLVARRNSHLKSSLTS